jgi:uncharacterized protein (DUF1697 family)
MPQCFAFLRAINVGGRNVKMDRLCEIFTDLGCEDVQTHIASGNVIFRTRKRNFELLSVTIEKALERELGFEVPVFLRTADELIQVAEHEPFPSRLMAEAMAYNVAFTAQDLNPREKESVEKMATDIDCFSVHGAEICWLCLRKQSETKIRNGQLERTLGRSATTRNLKTVRALAAKFAGWNGSTS